LLAFCGELGTISTLFMDAQTPTQSTDLYLKTVQWVHERRKPLMIGGIAVVVLGLVWAYSAWTKAKNETDANEQFFATPLGVQASAVSPTPLLNVASAYPSTAAGEHARILAAQELFTSGKYPEASQQFSDFINNYPDSALIPQAKIGAAACLVAEGKTTEAIAKYHDIILTYPSEMNILSPAKLTLARLYEDSNQLQQAMTYYVELARVQNPNDPWVAEARERAQLLASKHPELMKAMTSSAPTSAPSGFSLSDSTKPPAGNPAPKPAPPQAPTGNPGPKLLTTPGAPNSTGKP
jgi:TolA-binding protein